MTLPAEEYVAKLVKRREEKHALRLSERRKLRDKNKERERKQFAYYGDLDSSRAYQRRRHFLQKYRLTIEERDALLAAQGGVCAACGSESSDGGGNKGWHVDHDHKTGAVRGILCGACNVGLGHAKDSVEVLRKWIAYLER